MGFSCNPRKGAKNMRQFAKCLANFVRHEDGPTAVEYAVMLALIIVVCVTAVSALGTNTNKTFTKVSTSAGGSGS
jgi:pilus assembly protein Flp/PilA